jgi:hypothetical protein
VSRALEATELSQVKTLFAAVKVSGRTDCGADKDLRELTVYAPGESLTYGDDFYACSIKDKPVVGSEQIDSLAAKLRELATK